MRNAFFYLFIYFFKVCVKYSNLKPYRPINLYDMCKSDNINVCDVCLTLFYPSVDRIQDTVVQYKKKIKKLLIFDKKVLKKKEEKKMNLPFLDKRTCKEKWMRAGAFETEHFFLFSHVC